MFSGIIETAGSVTSVEKDGAERRITIRRPPRWKLRQGESVNVEGVCSTVQKLRRSSFEVHYMPETLRRTTLSQLRCSGLVNLERSLTLNSLIGGHLVQGHVDAVGRIVKIRRDGRSKIYTFEIPRRLLCYVVEKGSIAIDGISLTVLKPSENQFSISLLEYTLKHTTLGEKQIRDQVNVEVDILSKYVARLIKR